ncbi:hypothetical protein T11_5206 [Trichinella zimbabwensis]|uniref:Uncharacterized protein n=1 Tax=Trichinella zimbabwensis TaxID=268475 RepID=A0A0V1HHI8_9BILA|nr:hypothetical protein T11_5206 [Trichinella zimbabwensis]
MDCGGDVKFFEQILTNRPRILTSRPFPNQSILWCRFMFSIDWTLQTNLSAVQMEKFNFSPTFSNNP